MRKSLLFPLAVVALTLNSGCAERKRVSISTSPTAQQNGVFQHGVVKLLSQNHKTQLEVVDYSNDEMVITVSIANDTRKPIEFSEKNITALLLHFNLESNAKIYSYDELKSEYQNVDYSPAVKKVGQTAASIGASFIPFGNIALLLGNLIFSLTDNGGTDKNSIDSVVASQLDKMYLRRHTVEPKAEYGGIIKVGFAEQLSKGDKVLFNISIGDRMESFTFVCE